MIQVSVSNIGRVRMDFNNWLILVKEEETQRLRTESTRALHWLTRHSPQYSGDFAANWKVAVNEVDTSFEVGAVSQGLSEDNLYHQGSTPAIRHATQEGLPVIYSAHLGDAVTISNSAIHDRPYAWKIESDQILFRPENVEGGRVIGRYMASYKALDK
jgi:hypothetical protein